MKTPITPVRREAVADSPTRLTLTDAAPARPTPAKAGERRRHRRHELAVQRVVVEQLLDDAGEVVGEIVDLSAGGVRVRTSDPALTPGRTIDVRLTLPPHAGIRPFVRLDATAGEPSCEWIGRLEILRRVERHDGSFDLGGRLLDMTAVDRGMLGLYLSIQPLAA